MPIYGLDLCQPLTGQTRIDQIEFAPQLFGQFDPDFSTSGQIEDRIALGADRGKTHVALDHHVAVSCTVFGLGREAVDPLAILVHQSRGDIGEAVGIVAPLGHPVLDPI